MTCVVVKTATLFGSANGHSSFGLWMFTTRAKSANYPPIARVYKPFFNAQPPFFRAATLFSKDFHAPTSRLGRRQRHFTRIV